jgi:hypothetical protein
VEAVDKAAASLAAPQERLKKLLEARDKKAVLLEMAGAAVQRCACGEEGRLAHSCVSEWAAMSPCRSPVGHPSPCLPFTH